MCVIYFMLWVKQIELIYVVNMACVSAFNKGPLSPNGLGLGEGGDFNHKSLIE